MRNALTPSASAPLPARRSKTLIFPALLILGFAHFADAAINYTWNFDTPAGYQASPHVYFDTTHSYSLTAYAFSTASGPVNPSLGQSWGPGGGYNHPTGTVSPRYLFGKNEGAGETGLGIGGLPSNEIQYKSFIQLDLSNLYANGFSGLTMAIGSIQDDEGYYLWGSNTVGVPGVLLRTNLGEPVEDSFQVPSFGTYKYFSVSATPVINNDASDVLIMNGLTAHMPEPATLAFLAAGWVLSMSRRARRRL